MWCLVPTLFLAKTCIFTEMSLNSSLVFLATIYLISFVLVKTNTQCVLNVLFDCGGGGVCWCCLLIHLFCFFILFCFLVTYYLPWPRQGKFLKDSLYWNGWINFLLSLFTFWLLFKFSWSLMPLLLTGLDDIRLCLHPGIPLSIWDWKTSSGTC